MRLIDADALTELFREVIVHIAKEPELIKSLERMVRASAMIIEMLAEAPTVDAVPVVRCADCRHFRYNLRPDGYLPEGVGETECTLFYCGMDYTDFCSHAERRNDDKDRTV